MDLTTFLVSLVVIILLSYFISKCAKKFQDNASVIEACKIIIAAKFYENFKHMSLGQKLKEVEKLKKLLSDEHINDFSHPREFRVALKFYIAIMEHDIQLDMALIRVENMLQKMDEDESDNKKAKI